MKHFLVKFPIIKKKISRAVTDSGSEIIFDDKNKAGLSNLINIYKSLSFESISDIENKYKGKMYSHFKEDLSDIIIETLKPIKDEYDKLIKDKDYLLNVLKSGSEYGYKKSQKTLSKVYRKVGFIPKIL